MVRSLSHHPLSLAQCLGPSPLPSELRTWSRPQVLCLGHGSRGRLFPQVACEPLCGPSGLGPQCMSAEQASAGKWRGGVVPGVPCSETLPTQPPLPPPPARGRRTLARVRPPPSKGPADLVIALDPTQEECCGEAPGPHWVPGSGVDTRRRAAWPACPAAMVLTMVSGWIPNPSPSRCPSLPPRVTINVTALSIDNYSRTKSGRMGSAPQRTALTCPNSPWPEDGFPRRRCFSFAQGILLRDGQFSFRLDSLEHAACWGRWAA